MKSEEASVLETAEKLRETIRQGRSFAAGQVRVIGLDAIRDSLGDRWEVANARIRANSLCLIEGCIAPEDVVIPAGDGFLVIYAQCPGRDFAAECASIQTALNTFYLGEEGLRPLAAEVQHRTLDSRQLVHAIAGDGVPNQPETPRLDATYFPVWNAEKEALTEYWLAPSPKGEPACANGYDAEWSETRVHSNADYLDFDLSLLRRAVQDAEEALLAGRRCMIGFSVHASTMQIARRRSAYLRELYATPQAVRPYFLPRIAEIEPGTPPSRIAEWVHTLRHASERVAIQLHVTDRAVEALSSTAAWSVALVLPSAQFTAEEVASLTRHLQRWGPALQRQRIKFRVDNVVEPQLLRAALASQVEMITSGAIWPAARRPEGVKRCSRAQVEGVLADHDTRPSECGHARAVA